LLWLGERFKRKVKGENESEKRSSHWTDSAHGIPKFTAKRRSASKKFASTREADRREIPESEAALRLVPLRLI
jgi:hypothetical protein